MAVHSFSVRQAACHRFLACFVYFHYAVAFTSSVYQLDSEYSGANFFEGWDFYTGGDPTGGFVTYYSQGSAQLSGMINASDSSPIYIGTDYNTVIGSTQAAGRPSVRISTQRSWTHGLFIGDFNHAPGGVCGIWTLGPNWPYNGEIDIMEGANLITNNAATLHTSPNCTIAGDIRTMTGQLSNNNCAYYPGYNVGCGIVDNRTTSYGAGFNAIGGGVYAMQWTSAYISVWFFPRGSVPNDITNKNPNPSSWGLPFATMEGSCVIDQHFQAHKIVLNNALCGEYAGASTVWNSTTNSCAALTGYSTCDAYVAANPAPFQQSYWSINSVRVYQLVDPSANASSTGTAYIASNQPTQTSISTTSSSTPVPTTSLCPTYNFTVVQSGSFQYEIECGVNIGGSDIGIPYPSYQVHSFEDCVAGCSYWNTYNSSNICGGVTYQVSGNACYWKRNVGSTPADPNFRSARLIYYAYPQVTDDPRYQTSSSSSTSYVASSVTPQYYVAPGVTTSTSFSLISETLTSSITNGIPGLGGSTTDAASSSTSIVSTTIVATTGGSSQSTSTAMVGGLSSTASSSSSSFTGSTASTTSASIVWSTSSLSTAATTNMALSSSSSAAATSTMASAATSTSEQLPPSSSTLSSLSSVSPSQSTAVSASSPISASASSSSSTSTPSSSAAISSSTSSSSTITTEAQPPPPSSTTAATVSSPSSASTNASPISTSTVSPVFSSSSSQASPSEPPSSVSSSVSPPPPSSTTSSESPTSPPTASPPTTTTSFVASESTSSSPPSSPSSTSNSASWSSTPTTQIMISSSSSSPSSSSPAFSTTAPVSTVESTTTTTTTDTLPGPTQVSSFTFAGCLGPRPETAFAVSFQLVEDSPLMSIERCVEDCSLDIYAGIYDTQCYCSSYSLPLDTSSSEDFIQYPDSACNTTCPGNPAERCGGVAQLTPPDRLARRQLTEVDGDIILLTMYNNTDVDGGAGGSSSTSTSTSSLTTTAVTTAASSVPASSSESMSASVSMSVGASTSATTASLSSTTVPPTSSTPLSSFSDSGILASTTATPTPSPSSSQTMTLSPMTVSTTYTTICSPWDPISCPTRTETCLTTTITVLHCGCTEMPPAQVPMTTTVVEACSTTTQGSQGPTTPLPPAGGGGGGGGGSPEDETMMTTLTVPCTQSISALESAVSAWSAASYAQVGVNAEATATAPIVSLPGSETETENTNANTNVNGNAHSYVPYSFPISFPMTTTAAAATSGLAPEANTVVTKSLVLATAKFPFSVALQNSIAPPYPTATGGITNSTTLTTGPEAAGRVENVTVMPVPLSAPSSQNTANLAPVATMGMGMGMGTVHTGAGVKSYASSSFPFGLRRTGISWVYSIVGGVAGGWAWVWVLVGIITVTTHVAIGGVGVLID